MTFGDALRLGRVSNLPTVWTNGLAGIVLAGGAPAPALLLALLLALSLFYVGGMYLNDAFDADIDGRERPERPIPSGRVAARSVFAAGFAQLASGLALIAVVGLAVAPTGDGVIAPLTAGGALAAAIVIYDAWHKGNAFGPVIMGMCRALVYVTAALVVTPVGTTALAVSAAMLLCHVVGLSYAAKQEFGRLRSAWPLAVLAAPLSWVVWSAAGGAAGAFVVAAYATAIGFAVVLLLRRRPGDIQRAVGLLIAAISLYDAAIIAGTGETGLAIVAVLGFPLTLLLQRRIPGT